MIHYFSVEEEMCVDAIVFIELHIFMPGHTVAQLVEALHYRPEGCRFDSRWCHWDFSLT
jgi:hypothetical protein